MTTRQHSTNGSGQDLHPVHAYVSSYTDEIGNTWVLVSEANALLGKMQQVVEQHSSVCSQVSESYEREIRHWKMTTWLLFAAVVVLTLTIIFVVPTAQAQSRLYKDDYGNGFRLSPSGTFTPRRDVRIRPYWQSSQPYHLVPDHPSGQPYGYYERDYDHYNPCCRHPDDGAYGEGPPIIIPGVEGYGGGYW